MRHPVPDVQGRVDTTLASGGSDETFVSRLGIPAVANRKGPIARLGERVDLGAPTVSGISTVRDRLVFLGNSLVEVGEEQSFRFLLAQVGLDPLSGHHDTGLLLLRDVDLLR